MKSYLDLVDALEDMARQHCYTDKNGTCQGVAEPNITDSEAITPNAEALRTLHGFGRFRIVREMGRMVIGYWPEHDPMRLAERPVHAADCAVAVSARHAGSCGADAKDDTPCSPWRPASEPPNQTEWVLASADGAVRCVAWNNDVRRWENWDGALTSFVLGEIDWWMPIPPTPKKADSVAADMESDGLLPPFQSPPSSEPTYRAPAPATVSESDTRACACEGART